jgi:hypothetical protein
MAVKLRQRGDKWWLYVDYKGRRKAKCVGTDKRVAERAKKRVEAQLAVGAFGIATEERQRRPSRPSTRAGSTRTRVHIASHPRTSSTTPHIVSTCCRTSVSATLRTLPATT